MKILVVSDVHKEKERLEAILRENKNVEYIISLGDSELKSSFLEKHDIIAIKGNYPFDAGFTYEHEMVINQTKFLLVHGHKYNIRSGIETLYERMLETDVDVALYGHTHVAAFDVVEKRVLANPGSVYKSKGDLTESYLTIDIEPEYCLFKWLDARQHSVISEKEMKLKSFT
ncbi:MAG: metallophosphoesterase family protein [Candidatus Izemoplasmataceae bacterium]|jgi:uncharacterized protein|uniref:metallophosphoesterase family protein n=1 Tax=Liberiplasma polymorphum TaxID=3374570 RepID=UPI003775F1BF